LNISQLLNSLNTAQRIAVTAPLEHTLVLAGAGSGKTKVLTHRIAWLLETHQTDNLLAVTFTNRAAWEMHSRISALLNVLRPWIGTFHGLAHRLLRMHWQAARLPQSFQILDSADQLHLIKSLLKKLEIDEQIWLPSKIQAFINARKEEGLRADNELRFSSRMWDFYLAYEETCQRTGIVDFAELLLRSYELLRDNPTLLEHYQQRFQHILVDEFQDTNTIQYHWLQLLAGSSVKVFVVADEDQSIYSWRGARVDNIQDFLKNFPNVQLLRLEQNYRSTGTILQAANALISHNFKRLGKNLWTQAALGEPIYLYTAYNDIEEANFVVAKIRAWPGKRQDLAILYRTTAQSRVFEEALIRQNIPYRVYGGLRFYERAEIKDVLAYLRLILNRDDDGAFERIVNTPKRGLGERTLEVIRTVARQQASSLWQAARFIQPQLKPRASSALRDFLAKIELFTHQISRSPLHQQVEFININSGLLDHYQKEGVEEAQRRLENLEELVTAAHEFEKSAEVGDLPHFLAQAVLESGETQGQEFEDCVQLMTLHSAKGLEFPVVFLCGLEEDLFPHPISVQEGNLEEERRLCYVGITRARRYLYLCQSENRYCHGSLKTTRPSRFIREIPRELIEEIRFTTSASFFFSKK